MSPATEGLRAANHRLRAILNSLEGESGAETPAVTPEQLTGLLTELLRAGECLRSNAQGSSADPKMVHEISEYRSTVEQLRTVLPNVQARLLTERARLEAERAHLEAAADWASASKKTT